MDIRRVAVLGAGRLGRGIAENAASKGYDVILFSHGAGGKEALARIERVSIASSPSGASPTQKTTDSKSD